MTTLSVTETEGDNHKGGVKESNSLELRSLVKSLFNVKNVKSAFRTTFKRRENSLRSSIIVTGWWWSDHSQFFRKLTKQVLPSYWSLFSGLGKGPRCIFSSGSSLAGANKSTGSTREYSEFWE